MKRLILVLLTPTLAWGQCPSTPSPDFSCTTAGGNTHITLFANTDVNWDRFDVPMGGSLDISSAGGAGFSNRHLTTGLFPSTIEGGITGDGPFTLVNSAGIRMTDSGSIFAPSILLSTLPVTGPQTYQGFTRAEQMIVSGNVSADSGDVTLLSYNLTNSGSVTAPNGKVTVIATGSQTVVGPDLRLNPSEGAFGSQARVTNRGAIQAPVVEIYTEGFIQNGGFIQGEQVTLDGRRSLLHENKPGSLIVADQLTLPSGGVIEGPLFGPNDGNNPGGVSTTLGLPDLEKGSFTSKRKTTLLPAQFSSSNVARSRVPSAVSRKTTSGSSRLATRGAAKKKSSKKRSFFGTVIQSGN